MPKNTTPRTIDERRNSGGYTFFSGNSGGGGVTDHGLLTGLADDDHTQYLNNTRGDLRYVPLTRQVTGTGGLTGGGALSGDLSLSLATGVAGLGLAWASTGVLKVGAGDGLAVVADSVGLATGVAGDGLAWASAGVLKVGAGDGISVAADAVAVNSTVARSTWPVNAGMGLTDGGNLAAAGITLNVAVANTGAAGLSVEANAVRLTSSSNPGAAAAVLATDAAGKVQLVTAQVTGTIYADGAIDLGTDTLYEDASYLYIAGTKPLNVGSSMLVVDGAASVVGIGVTPDGAATLDVKAKTNSDHTVRVTQKSGQTGRLWRIEDTGGDELIVLDSQGNLQSGQPGFVSGLTGWQITPTGTAEFNNVWVRGELHASIFVMDEFHSNGGTFVTATAGKLENDAVLSNTSDVATTNCRSTAFAETFISYRYNSTETGDNAARSIENWIEVTDPPSGHAILFTRGQILRCKTFTGTDVYDLWLRVNSTEDMTDYYRYRVQVMSGTYTTLPAGAAVIRYGEEGDGLILQTADLNYAPYLDVFTIGAEPWNGDITPHVRLGRLDGVGVPLTSGIEQYGIVAGTNLSDATAPYFVASDRQIAQYRISSTWNDGTNNTVKIESDGHVLIGTNVDTAAGVAFDFDPANGVLRVGNSTYGGQILVYGDGGGVTNIDGGNIQTGTITADKITAGTITTTQLNFTPVQTNNVVASINATAEGIRIAGNRITIDGDVTFSAGYNPTTKITAGGAAADVNANVTTISGGKITTGSITADRMNVSTLAAIVADLGAITAGSIVIGSTNKLWLNDSADGALNIGGATKASAPFRVAATGALTATNVSITAGALVLDSTGATVTTQSAYSIDRGYKFKFGGASGAGLTAQYTSTGSKTTGLALWNNTTDDGSTAVISDADAYLRLKNVAASTKTSTTEIIAYQSAGAKTASLSLVATASTSTVTIGGTSLLFNSGKIWHEGNDGATSTLDADLLDGQHGAYYAAASSLSSYAAKAGDTFTGDVTFSSRIIINGASNAGGTIELTPLTDDSDTALPYVAGKGILYIKRSGNSMTLKIALCSPDSSVKDKKPIVNI